MEKLLNQLQANIDSANAWLSVPAIVSHPFVIEVENVYTRRQDDGTLGVVGNPIHADGYKRADAEELAPQITNGNGTNGKAISRRQAVENFRDNAIKLMAELRQLGH